ncbi:LysM peptidoglycan-binding domain-containing protein [Candidatus Gottesmanbacteria bacterium]|nr:LysM peptidoglycan-binding domain-containing protein [Candidatus Gottesmanbacteria bacterium]
MTTRQFIERGLSAALIGAAVYGIATPASAQNCKDYYYTVVKDDNVSKIGERYGLTVSDILAKNYLANPNLIHVGNRLVLCLKGDVGGPSNVLTPVEQPTPVPTPDANTAKPGSSPEYPVRLVDGLYFTFAPNQELWVALGPDQFDEQHNKIGLQLETINGRPDSMQGLAFAPDRVPAVTSWFKTQGDMPAPTAQLLAKRSNNDEDWNKIGADFGNLWFRDPITGKYQPWLLRLKNAGREGAGPVEPVTFRLGIKPFYQ